MPRKDLVKIVVMPPRRKKSPKKASSPSKLKKELDRVFSLFVRQYHAKRCFTCGKETNLLQCGHFIPRSYLATRWDFDNCRPQCVGCNIWGRGKLLDFEDNLIKEIGLDRVTALKQKRREVWKLKPEWYVHQINKYTQALVKV